MLLLTSSTDRNPICQWIPWLIHKVNCCYFSLLFQSSTLFSTLLCAIVISSVAQIELCSVLTLVWLNLAKYLGFGMSQTQIHINPFGLVYHIAIEDLGTEIPTHTAILFDTYMGKATVSTCFDICTTSSNPQSNSIIFLYFFTLDPNPKCSTIH